MIDPDFTGQTVVIVAGGPSLAGFDFDRLRGRTVIAINRAYEFCPEATMLWWSDRNFWKGHWQNLLAHAAPFRACAGTEIAQEDMPASVRVWPCSGVSSFDPHPDRIRHGNNSTYAAIHVAAHRGARKIIPLGLDMRFGPAGETHFHGGHGVLLLEQTLKDDLLPHFATLAPWLAALGIEVVNGSPNSAVEIWPRCTPEEALA